MRGWIQPVGGKSPQVYWLRRALVVIILTLVIVGLVHVIQLLVNGKSDNAKETIAASVAPNNSETNKEISLLSETTPSGNVDQPDSVPAPESSKEPTVPPSETPTASATPEQKCDPGKMRITLTAAREVTNPGALKMDMSVINGSGSACVLELDGSNQELTVTSGDQLVWTTKHCAKWMPSGKFVLEAEQSKAWSVTWPLRMSAQSCKISSDKLADGTYLATFTLKGNSDSAKRVIKLHS